jgi:hypothetical protein
MKITDVTLTFFTWEGLPPMKAGLGVEIDFDLIKRNTQFVLQ